MSSSELTNNNQNERPAAPFDELSKNSLVCVCRPCSILFGDPSAGSGKYRLVPSRYLLLPDFQMTDEQWEELTIPVNMVYIFHSTPADRVMAFYPSPAGAIESTLSLQGWDALVNSNTILKDLEPDVEALLINRVESYLEHYIVPIDTCYELVGLIRLKWKGLSGGEEVWKAIAEFFASLRKRAIITEVNPQISTQPRAFTPWRGEANA